MGWVMMRWTLVAMAPDFLLANGDELRELCNDL